MSSAENQDGAAAAKPEAGVGFDIEEVQAQDESPTEPKTAQSQNSGSGGDAGGQTATSFDELMSRVSTGDGNRGQALVPEDLKADVRKLNHRIKSMNKFLMDPKSKFMQYWDFFTLGALLFTATVTPYEVALLPTKLDALFVLNWLVNLIFVMDMIINFLLPYKESAKKGGGTVKSHGKIAKKYLTSWFLLDFVSILPFDSIEVFASLSGSSPFGENASTLKIIKMIRLARLLKLARILRASRIFSRWENELGMSYSKLSLIFWSGTVFMVMHLLACLWCLVASMMNVWREDTDLGLEEQVLLCRQGSCVSPLFNGTAGESACTGCAKVSAGGDAMTEAICKKNSCLTPCEFDIIMQLKPHFTLDYIAATENWKCRYQANIFPDVPEYPYEGHAEQHVNAYFAALYVAMLMVGGGVGSIVPENTTEYFVVAFSLLGGSTVWALIVGSICGLVATGDPHATEFKQKMDELNYFMKDMNITRSMRVRAREYYRQTRDLRKKLSYGELVERLSPTLRGEMVLQMSRSTLEKVWYLKACEPEFLVELAVEMMREGFAPREKIPSEKLCIVMRGVAAKAGNILTNGDYWGEDMIVSSRALRDVRHASALTYVEVGTISRDTLEELLEQFPKSEREIRQSAMKIAMQRAIVVISEFVRLQQAARAGVTGVDKLATMMVGASVVPEKGSSNDPNDPSVILSMITGGKLKDIDDDGQIVEEDEDEVLLEPGLRRTSTSGGLDTSDKAVLKEIRALRLEVANLAKKVGKK